MALILPCLKQQTPWTASSLSVRGRGQDPEAAPEGEPPQDVHRSGQDERGSEHRRKPRMVAGEAFSAPAPAAWENRMEKSRPLIVPPTLPRPSAAALTAMQHEERVRGSGGARRGEDASERTGKGAWAEAMGAGAASHEAAQPADEQSSGAAKSRNRELTGGGSGDRRAGLPCEPDDSLYPPASYDTGKSEYGAGGVVSRQRGEGAWDDALRAECDGEEGGLDSSESPEGPMEEGGSETQVTESEEVKEGLEGAGEGRWAYGETQEQDVLQRRAVALMNDMKIGEV